MFARQAFRAAQPFRQTARRCYASSPAASGSNTLVYSVLGAGAVGGGGYFYYTNYGPGAKPEPESTPLSSSAQKTTVPAIPFPNPTSTASQTSGQAAFTGGEQGFIDLKLDSVEKINHNTKKFRFALPNSDDVSGLQIASALLTKYEGPGMQKPAIRPYTPTSDEDERGFLDLIVKRYPGGAMSEHLHSMAPGQRLEFKGPIAKYPWSENKHDHIALIAGGTGITPMYQLIRAIFKNPADKTKVTLVLANVTEDDILLKDELYALENTFPQRFKAFYTLDTPPENWGQGKGFVTKELLQTVLPEAKGVGKGGKKGEDVKVFVCGPPGFYKAVSGPKEGPKQGKIGGYLKELGFEEEEVYKF